jgi:hypothetical protein
MFRHQEKLKNNFFFFILKREEGKQNGRHTKKVIKMWKKQRKPKIQEKNFYVLPKEGDENVRSLPEGLHTALTAELGEIALSCSMETCHIHYWRRDDLQARHARCDLRQLPEKRVQHWVSCPEHTIIYLLPEDISVRVNPVILDTDDGYETVENPVTKQPKMVRRRRSDICEDVTIRYAGREVPRYLVDILESVGTVEERKGKYD